MRIAIGLGKAITLMFWLAELFNLFRMIPAPTSQLLHGAAVVILILHLFEVAIMVRLHGRYLIEPKLDKMQVLVFGVFHWLEIMRRIRQTGQRQAARGGRPGKG